MPVDAFNAALRVPISFFGAAFGALHPLVGLSMASVLIGIGMLWVVGKTSDQAAIERAKKRMQAHLLEMRLFADEPRMLIRAQGNLLLNNARYMGHMLRPAAVLALPMVVLFAHFDSLYGRRPLGVGETALVAVAIGADGSDLTLSATGPLRVDSTSVLSAAEGTTYWRVRGIEDGRGKLVLETRQGTLEKAVEVGAGAGASYLSATRSGRWWERLLLAPGENGLASNAVQSISIEYPARAVGIGSWETHWIVWFLGISIIAAFLLRGYFGVVL